LPKYVNSPQTPTFDKSSTLYGIDLAARAIRQEDRAIVMEGYMDVITAHQNGIKNAVASMGTALTETQVNTLKKLSRNPVLALDADAAGEEAMLRGVSYENALDNEIRVVTLPENKDPDDVIREDVKLWQSLVDEAVPIVDYTIDKVTSRLDLTTAKDKSYAVERLLPIISEIMNPVRQAHYLQKLARLVGVSERTLEATLSKMKTPARRRAAVPKPATVPRTPRPLASDPREEYCLSLLLQHPELKNSGEDLPPEYFESSENRAIFTTWQETDDLLLLKDRLDLAIHEHLDAIVNRELPTRNLEQRFHDCILELKKKYLRSQAARISEILALEAEAGGAGADIAGPARDKELLEICIQLKEVFTQRKQKQTEIR
jgi:DNA primase